MTLSVSSATEKQHPSESLKRDVKYVTRKGCARTVDIFVLAVQAIQDFVIFPALNVITPNSNTGCEITCCKTFSLYPLSILT